MICRSFIYSKVQLHCATAGLQAGGDCCSVRSEAPSSGLCNAVPMSKAVVEGWGWWFEIYMNASSLREKAVLTEGTCGGGVQTFVVFRFSYSSSHYYTSLSRKLSCFVFPSVRIGELTTCECGRIPFVCSEVWLFLSRRCAFPEQGDVWNVS